MNPRVSVLNDEFTAKRSLVENLDQLCADEKRDLTDDERTDYDAALTRMEAISADIEKINTRTAKFDSVAAVTAAVNGTDTAPARTNPRPELTFADKVIARALDGESGNGIVHRMLDEHRLLGDYETVQRALLHGISTDGNSPTTLEGDLKNFIDARRQAVSVANRKAMPDNRSKTFERPSVTARPSVAVQTNEGDVLSSTRMNLVSETVTKKTYGGTLAISEQSIDWSDPSLLGEVTQGLARAYAIETDNFLCDAIEAVAVHGATPTPLSQSATLAQVIASVIDASLDTYTDSKQLPNVILAAPDRWAYLSGLLAGDGRPAFPQINPTNAAGSNAPGATSFAGLNVLGLPVVVDPNFTSGFWATAATDLIEFYEQDKGLLSVQAPSTLETIVAYRGYVAAFVWDEGVHALTA